MGDQALEWTRLTGNSRRCSAGSLSTVVVRVLRMRKLKPRGAESLKVLGPGMEELGFEPRQSGFRPALRHLLNMWI